MTAVDTPSREELLALADDIEKGTLTRSRASFGQFTVDLKEKKAIVAALRLAAKPTDDGVREVTIEECAGVAENFYNIELGPHLKPVLEIGKVAAKQIAAAIRSTKAPKP